MSSGSGSINNRISRTNSTVSDDENKTQAKDKLDQTVTKRIPQESHIISDRELNRSNSQSSQSLADMDISGVESTTPKLIVKVSPDNDLKEKQQDAKARTIAFLTNGTVDNELNTAIEEIAEFIKYNGERIKKLSSFKQRKEKKSRTEDINMMIEKIVEGIKEVTENISTEAELSSFMEGVCVLMGKNPFIEGYLKTALMKNKIIDKLAIIINTVEYYDEKEKKTGSFESSPKIFINEKINDLVNNFLDKLEPPKGTDLQKKINANKETLIKSQAKFNSDQKIIEEKREILREKSKEITDEMDRFIKLNEEKTSKGGSLKLSFKIRRSNSKIKDLYKDSMKISDKIDSLIKKHKKTGFMINLDYANIIDKKQIEDPRSRYLHYACFRLIEGILETRSYTKEKINRVVPQYAKILTPMITEHLKKTKGGGLIDMLFLRTLNNIMVLKIPENEILSTIEEDRFESFDELLKKNATILSKARPGHDKDIDYYTDKFTVEKTPITSSSNADASEFINQYLAKDKIKDRKEFFDQQIDQVFKDNKDKITAISGITKIIDRIHDKKTKNKLKTLKEDLVDKINESIKISVDHNGKQQYQILEKLYKPHELLDILRVAKEKEVKLKIKENILKGTINCFNELIKDLTNSWSVFIGNIPEIFDESNEYFINCLGGKKTVSKARKNIHENIVNTLVEFTEDKNKEIVPFQGHSIIKIAMNTLVENKIILEVKPEKLVNAIINYYKKELSNRQTENQDQLQTRGMNIRSEVEATFNLLQNLFEKDCIDKKLVEKMDDIKELAEKSN